MSKVYKKILPYIAAFVIAYLISNIVWSQNISNVYFKLVGIKSAKKDMQESAYNLLVSIRKLSVYNDYLRMFKDVFGKTIEQDVNYENKKRLDYLNSLNGLIGKNPKSRDVLYKLYLYYKNEGDEKKANEYLIKAQKIDPVFTFEK
jgi:tetratricopeptide (TPR) repeat protein